MTDSPHRIRPLEPADRDALIRMRQGMWPDSTEDEVDALIRGNPPGFQVLVAVREDHGLCGFAELGSRRYAEGCDTSPVAYLEGIWVDPDARRSGVALALVRHAEQWARAAGFSELGSDCLITNEASQAFHLAAGFREIERIVCYQRPLSPDP